MSETQPATKEAETAQKPAGGTVPAEQQDAGRTNDEAAKLRRELKELRAKAKEADEYATKWKQHEESQKSAEERALKLQADLEAERKARQADKVHAAVGMAATAAGLPPKLLPALLTELGAVDLDDVAERVKDLLGSDEWKPFLGGATQPYEPKGPTLPRTASHQADEYPRGEWDVMQIAEVKARGLWGKYEKSIVDWEKRRRGKATY